VPCHGGGPEGAATCRHRSGEPVGEAGPAVTKQIPEGYGESGFQVSSLNFSGPGCWRVVGRLDGDSLEFVLRVEG
jgi:hypothetical protein